MASIVQWLVSFPIDKAMPDVTVLRRQRYLVLLTFALVTAVILSGFALGPSGKSRAAFTLEGNPIWDAGARAEALLPTEGRDVPLVVGPGLDEGEDDLKGSTSYLGATAWWFASV